MQDSQKKRSDAIDVAKGIGILLVIYAHLNTSEPLLTIIYSFHMPLFFILAGLVMNTDKYQTIKSFLKNKFKTLIIPYIFFCVLGIIMVVCLKLSDIFIYHVRWEDAASFFGKAIYSVIWAPYSKKYFISFNTPMWFVPCLVLIELMYYMIRRILKNKTIWIVLTCFMLTAAGWVMEADLFPFDFSALPFNFSSACFSIGFFAIGNISAPYVKKMISSNDSKNKIVKYAATLGISASILTVTALMNGKVSIGSRILGNGFLFYLSGVSGTLFVLVISKILERSRILKFCGRNSFNIMGCHMVIHNFLHYIWNLLFQITPTTKKIGIVFDLILTPLLSLAFVLILNKLLIKLRSKKHGRTA